ncbi:hypothetical protein SDC9_102327 [bioreactor metagenome]|uniref:Type II secretion system protein J n=1 Tax=bioreactor metagenome TaxID=1076179 RepID=A0A645AQZ1_9ZZZZ
MKRRGFTLVEILVAITLLAMVSVIIASSLSAFQRSYDKVARLSQKLTRNRALDRIAEHLRNAIPFYWPDETDDNVEHLVFQGAEEELWFATRQRAGADGKGALLFLRLYVDDDHNLKCDYRDLPFLPWLELKSQNYRTEIIAQNVDRVHFLYADWNDDDEIDWLEVWDQDDEDYEDRLPPAIQFSVEFTDGETVNYLRRTAAISAFSGLVE